ncbi:hypothetical protein PSPO01_05015 [Paraphaeosphaeria sporulosa]
MSTSNLAFKIIKGNVKTAATNYGHNTANIYYFSLIHLYSQLLVLLRLLDALHQPQSSKPPFNRNDFTLRSFGVVIMNPHIITTNPCLFCGKRGSEPHDSLCLTRRGYDITELRDWVRMPQSQSRVRSADTMDQRFQQSVIRRLRYGSTVFLGGPYRIEISP